MIEMKNVYKEYSHGVMAVDGLTVNIDAGEFVYIVGASGAGKSSFIKMMYREELATKGEVLIEGKNVTDMKLKDVPFLRRDIGVIFQDFKLLPRLTAFENVAFALEVIEENPKKINKRVLEVLEMVGLKQKARFLPNQLSGGEQQRVAIAGQLSTIQRLSLLMSQQETWTLKLLGKSCEFLKRSIHEERQSLWRLTVRKS